MFQSAEQECRSPFSPMEMSTHANPDAADLELSIVMPCLNEAETIELCIEKAQAYLARTGIQGEILIADNGSVDASRDIAVARNARVIVVNERGYGAALRGGILAARGRYIVMGDADDSYDFSNLDAFIYKLREGFDLVVGNRFKGGIATKAMPFLHRYLGNPVLSLIGRIFFRTGVKDFHCGLRGFNRERVMALDLRTSGMEFASEMIVASSLHKYRITEVPTRLNCDGRSRPPHLRTWRDGWRHLQFLLIYSPNWLFIYPGCLFMLLGLTIDSLLLPGPLKISSGIILGIHTLIVASMAILVGVQCIGFGFVARSFAVRYRLLPEIGQDTIMSKLTPKILLSVAVMILLFGFAGVGWSISMWAQTNFGALSYPIVARVLILSSTAVASGLQLAFLAFFSHIINLPIALERVRSVGT